MDLLGVQSVLLRKKSKSTPGITAENLLQSKFSAETPNEKWATDVIEFKITGTKVVLKC